MTKLKYKIGDEIIVKDGCAHGRNGVPSGKVKGKIIEVLNTVAFYPFNYGVRFRNHVYLVIESEIIDEPEKVIFT